MPTRERCSAQELDPTPPTGFQSRTSGEHGDRLWAASPISLLVGLFCLQSALFLGFATHRIDTRLYLIAHLSLCATAAVVGLRCAGSSSTPEEASDKTAAVIQLLVWTVLAGPFGTATAAMLFVPRSPTTARTEAKAGGAASDTHPEVSRLERMHAALLDRRLRVADAHRIRPLLDVIVDGTQDQKFDALGLISKRFSPALAPTLRRALEDKDGSVRVLAATVLAQQHNAHTKRIGTLQTEARAHPTYSERWSELGQARLDYAFSGLLDASGADAELSNARADVARAEQISAYDVRKHQDMQK
jgi:hypothetical protein